MERYASASTCLLPATRLEHGLLKDGNVALRAVILRFGGGERSICCCAGMTALPDWAATTVMASRCRGNISLPLFQPSGSCLVAAASSSWGVLCYS